MLKVAYNYGVKAALTRLKVALPLSSPGLGADYGVGPSGPIVSHGTRLLQYPPQEGANPEPGKPYHATTDSHGKDYGSDFLWNMSEYDKLAPGYSGEWGQEVIG